MTDNIIRGPCHWLSDTEIVDLHAALRRGDPTRDLMTRFNISERTLKIHRAKVLRPNKDPIVRSPWRSESHGALCRHGSCMRSGTGKPPFCDDHKPKAKVSLLPPSELAEIPMEYKMAGRARSFRRAS